ncbi:MAG: NAD(P)/FAD-dependent oxidoreductase [Halobacteriovoraceae bacterium]|nr:NAD(P)/FAD-dependent oxidoreductase [Halobacteriovoraceae bacterium]
MRIYDVIVLGGGAAGLFCAAQVSARGTNVLVIEKNKKVGLKIQVSGGGRCNFTNQKVQSEDFYSENPRFSKSALAQYSSEQFISLVKSHNIEFYEKKLGQLFCRKNSFEIINLLLDECKKKNVEIKTEVEVLGVTKDKYFEIKTSKGLLHAKNLVVATGGLSFKKLGASNIGFEIAKRFGLKVTGLVPALVPFLAKGYTKLVGISLPVVVKVNKKVVEDDFLFTHKGFSGPAILKASLYWNAGDKIEIDFCSKEDLEVLLENEKKKNPNKTVKKLLIPLFPTRFLEHWLRDDFSKPLQELSKKKIKEIADSIHRFQCIPDGTEGYDKAEVTRGGVSTKELDSKTMEVKSIPGLYFIGEVVDVTGLLGGYNFQWAWSSAYLAGKHIKDKL